MANKTYINNKETGHIELHFTKEEYKALTDEQSKLLKSNYLWSRTAEAWVSRSIKNTYYAEEIAKKLGFENGGSVGERLTYEEELNRKAEKAEHRAERYEQYSENAENRAEQLQSAFNSHRGDIAFLTQPNINSSSGRTFTNYRNKIMDRYNKGFDEYRKSEYFQERAETARATADMKQLKNKVYLDNRIKECNSNIKKYEGYVINYEDLIYKKQNNIEILNIRCNEMSIEDIQNRLNNILEKMEYELDKLAFLQNCLDDIGGINYSKENILPGYLVKIRGSWSVVLKANKTTVDTKIIEGGAAGMVLRHSYAEIKEMKIPENFAEVNKKLETVENPYNIDDILYTSYPANNEIYHAYQVIKVTDKSITIQQINLNNGKPIKDAFKEGSKPERKGIVKSKYSDYVGAYYNDWQLYKYNEPITA
jgi:hypothetical protein